MQKSSLFTTPVNNAKIKNLTIREIGIKARAITDTGDKITIP